MNKITLFLCLVATVISMSCSRTGRFGVKGVVYGADNASLVLERPGFNGSWVALDSVRTDSHGNFSISSDSPEYPEIYRLRLNDSFVYFPIDSAENLSVTSSVSDFGIKYKIEGSPLAEKMCRFDMDLRNLNYQDSASLSKFKRKVAEEIILPGKGDILSYYVLTRQIGTHPLFSVANPEDAGIIGAVANMYSQYRPMDPRTAMLASMASEARRNRNRSLGRKTVLNASESSVLDFTLKDKEDKDVTFSTLIGKGRPVMLVFSPLTRDGSVDVTEVIAGLYRDYGSKVNFVQVCPDPDILAWRERAGELKWNVLNEPAGDYSGVMAMYNVRRMPAFYFYNKNGELIDSAPDMKTAAKKLASF